MPTPRGSEREYVGWLLHPFSEIGLSLEWYPGMFLQYDLRSLLAPTWISPSQRPRRPITSPYLGRSVKIAAERLLKGNILERIRR